MKSLGLAFLLVIVATAATAQTPYLVDDINTTASAAVASSSPKNFVRFGSRIYFSAQSYPGGTELWATDGTAAGTAQVADINPGFGNSSPSRFAVVNGVLLFNANDGGHGEELWSTDGTKDGTRLFADIYTGFHTSSPGDRVVYHGKMLFSADDGVHGSELWITDGTPGGTHFLKDLVPGAGGSVPTSFVIFKDEVYFGAANGLWKSDGTADGTVLVKSGVYIAEITVAGSWMFLVGQQAWASDGTEGGTYPLRDYAPGVFHTVYLGSTVAFRGGVLFPDSDPDHGTELWFSDGTPAGTHMVVDLDGNQNSSLPGGAFGVIGDKAYFAASSPSTGRELWETDGTAAGTRVLDIVPGPDSSNPSNLVTVGSRVFFLAPINNALSLWMTDGTVGGTHTVGTPPVAVALAAQSLTNIDGVVYFAGANALNGFELWKSDGTDAGTSMILNIAADGAPSSSPANLTPANDWLYFDAWDGSGSTANGGTPRSLWRTDGTAAGTVKLATDPHGPYLTAGHTLLFNLQATPLISDGTPEGTGPATELVNRFKTRPAFFTAIGDTLLVSVSPDFVTSELWATKVAAGSPAVRLAAVSVSWFVPMANRVLFFGRQNSFSLPPMGLWVTDGTPAGTHSIVPDLGVDNPTSWAVAGGYFYFATVSPAATKLWRSDGTFEGTTVVKTFPAVSSLTNLTAARAALFFIIGGQLWVSDGTDSGTRSLSVAATPPFAAAGDRMIFSSGSALWVSDGTAAGTHALHDTTGTAVTFTFTSELVPAAGVVYFNGSDPQHGTELWSTDGTDAGTHMVADIEPLTAGSFPKTLVPSGEHLFFSATTQATGTELWALTLPLRLSINDVFVSESDARAAFVVTLSRASSQSVTVSYATSDGSALTGKDYDAVSGTLTFAPGETTKSITVPLHGNSTPENNRTFLVTLSNASGAALGKPVGFAVIEDDDGTADVALSSDFSSLSTLSVFMKATNHGPRVATGLKITRTVTPAAVAASDCASCPRLPLQLLPGETETAMEYRWSGQQYFTATLTAEQRDPDLSNNSVGWVRGDGIAMDALYLTPGADANIWCVPTSSALTIESSNPAVVSVPGTLPANANSFVAHGVSAGTATIRVIRAAPQSQFALTVDVFAPGTKVRWPGGVDAYGNNTLFPIDQPNVVSIYTPGTAPYSGAFATGMVVVSENGQELGRTTIGPGLTKLPVYVTQLDRQNLTIDYSGDANFLPATFTSQVWSQKGFVTIAASHDVSGSSVILHLALTGSPRFVPTGTITVSEPGGVSGIQQTLSAGRADVTLSGLTGGRHVFVLSYAGDSTYFPGTQNVAVTIGKHRAAGH